MPGTLTEGGLLIIASILVPVETIDIANGYMRNVYYVISGSIIQRSLGFLIAIDDFNEHVKRYTK